MRAVLITAGVALSAVYVGTYLAVYAPWALFWVVVMLVAGLSLAT